MAKLLCTCGQMIFDQTDFIRNKAHLIADQDYEDLCNEVGRGKEDTMVAIARYFHEVFQCDQCHNLILIRNNERFDFSPLEKERSARVLESYLGGKWLGTMSANFWQGKGEIYWNTNLESGFRQQLNLNELKELYNKKFAELKKLNVLRHSFLRIDGHMAHQYEHPS